MDEQKEQEPPVVLNGEGEAIAKVIITCNLKTGVIQMGGHIANKYLVLKMLVTAGQSLLENKNVVDTTFGAPPIQKTVLDN